jgi:hypothetical protein
MKMDLTYVYQILFIAKLLLFIWYYLTLPGSVLSPNKKYPKPSLKTAFMSYLIYMIPSIILMFNSQYMMKNII